MLAEGSSSRCGGTDQSKARYDKDRGVCVCVYVCMYVCVSFRHAIVMRLIDAWNKSRLELLRQ